MQCLFIVHQLTLYLICHEELTWPDSSTTSNQQRDQQNISGFRKEEEELKCKLILCWSTQSNKSLCKSSLLRKSGPHHRQNLSLRVFQNSFLMYSRKEELYDAKIKMAKPKPEKPSYSQHFLFWYWKVWDEKPYPYQPCDKETDGGIFKKFPSVFFAHRHIQYQNWKSPTSCLLPHLSTSEYWRICCIPIGCYALLLGLVEQQSCYLQMDRCNLYCFLQSCRLYFLNYRLAIFSRIRPIR